MLPTILDVIEAERACTRLVMDFAAHADLGDYELVAALFTGDGSFVRRGETFQGRTAIADSIDAQLQNRRSAPRRPWWRVRHFCSNVRIEVEAPDQATGTAYYVIYRYQGEVVEGVPPIMGPALVGDYADVYVRTVEGWRIARREVHPAFTNPNA